MAEPTRIRLDGLALDIRPSVACRERTVDAGVLFYLSLLDDEIESRSERFLDTFTSVHDGACHLELTDAVVLHARGGTVLAARGASCTIPLYWSRDRAAVHISTVLPLGAGAKFSKAGFASAISAVCLQGSYEPNACAETPLAQWRRLRRGVLTIFELGAEAREEDIEDRLDAADETADEETIAERVRSAFSEYSWSQRYVRSAVLELSGGFDSTLAGAAARTPRNTIRGISVEFPYYEFRFEAAVQQATGEALGIPRTVLDGTRLFPYAPWEHPPRFDEPAVFVTGIRHAEEVAGFAAEHAASRIYVGHGGDQLFSTDLTGSETVSNLPARAPFTREAWRAVERAIAEIRRPRWLRRATGLFVYDARQDVWVKETFGACIRTPFSDLALFRAARMWSRWSAARNVRPDKTILARAVADLLPRAVTERRGKVAYDGVWMRAYAAHGDHIAATLDRAAPVLEHIGVSPAWLARRVKQLAAWEPVSDREVLAAYAVAVWLISWSIERGSDIAWE